jgi:hypothetical protein
MKLEIQQKKIARVPYIRENIYAYNNKIKVLKLSTLKHILSTDSFSFENVLKKVRKLKFKSKEFQTFVQSQQARLFYLRVSYIKESYSVS